MQQTVMRRGQVLHVSFGGRNGVNQHSDSPRSMMRRGQVLHVSFGGRSPAVLYEATPAAVTASKDGTCKLWCIDVRYK
jgi:hypothetical protein